MEHALVSALVEQMFSFLVLEVKEKVRLVVNVRKQVEKLKRTFEVIKCMLIDAEQKQMTDIDKAGVKIWLEEIRNMIYDMEDVMDEWTTKTLLKSQTDGGKQQVNKKVSSCLCSPFSCLNYDIAFHHDIRGRIQKIRKRLDRVATYGFLAFTSRPEFLSYAERLETSSINFDPDICGLESDKKLILNKLFGFEMTSTSYQEIKASTEPAHIISIIGMGGLGKTTLAQLVFNDDQVKIHFEKIMWVYDSGPFDLKRIAKEIIQQATQSVGDSNEWRSLERLEMELYKSVEGKKFLLVLDGLERDNEVDLNRLKNLLRHGAQGSCILVTTRNERVASMMNSSYKHFLGILSFDDCWSLLCRKAFIGIWKEEDNDQVLKEISVELAKKCKGLPLAAHIVGNMLNKKRTKRDWSHVLESNFWELKGVDQQKILKPAMFLSYDDLSSPLKLCFAYCAVFPKDHLIKKQTLIKMWMAQGFLKSNTKTEEMESIGERYFNDLAARSFFQDFHLNDDGSIFCCKMHDLVHDFVQFLTKNECHMIQDSETFVSNDTSKARHLTLIYNEDEVEPSSFQASINKVEKVRTLHVFRNKQKLPLGNAHLSSDLFNHLRCLRVLNLKGMDIRHLPREIEKLILLRYLNLSRCKILDELPTSMCSLYNLQTLKLKGCEKLRELPRGMVQMINLRHLDIRMTGLSQLPEGIEKLNRLQF